MQTYEKLDRRTRRTTSFDCFASLILAKGGYRPTIRRDVLGFMGDIIAHHYDENQKACGDPRRAYRGN